MNTLMKASREWASRPDDERYLTLEALREAVASRRAQSDAMTPQMTRIRAVPTDTGDVVLDVPDWSEDRHLSMTHWSAGQLAGRLGIPAQYLRKLPAELAAINLQWGLEHPDNQEAGMFLVHSNGQDRLRAVTSPTYGRIWDAQVVAAVCKVNGDGRWKVPAASYQNANPKRATTLYASDRDVFIFLVDPDHPIETHGETLFRGFFAWNSEVGAATFGLTTFLYRYVCDNRIVWGATDVQELRIRHTRGAPDRFALEGGRYLKRYAEESPAKLTATVSAARTKALPVGKQETVEQWLVARGFTRPQANGAVGAAVAESGERPRTVWDMVQGVTAYARQITHTDARVDVEAKGGALLALAGG